MLPSFTPPGIRDRRRTADDVIFGIGTSSPAAFLWETADANANAFLLRLPTGGGTDVPVFVSGDARAENVDLGMFNGFTQPLVATLDADQDSYVGFHYSGDDVGIITMRLGSGGTIRNHVIPDVASSTFAVLGATQAWTADQTFNDDVSILLGTSGGESDITSNGSNTYWNLVSGSLIFQAGGATDWSYASNSLDIAAGTLLTINAPIRLDSGAAIVAGTYVMGRDADGTNQMHFNVPASATFEFSINDGAELVLDDSSLDLSNNTLLNVGAAGNDWTANDLMLNGGSAAQTLSAYTTGSSADAFVVARIPASSSGTAVFLFQEGSGDGSGGNMQYAFGYPASVAYLRLASSDIDGSGGNGDIWRVLDGQLTIDANTTWDENVFDEYDDAMVLWRAFGMPNRTTVYERGRELLRANTEELVELGVLRRYPDGWIGHNDMRMEALLAGGVYQNRFLIEQTRDELVSRIEELEGQVAALAA